EAERQAIEKADREKAAAAKRTAEVNARMNRLLRGGSAEDPSKKQQPGPQQGPSGKLRKRLERIAPDEADPENAQGGQEHLDGTRDHATGAAIKKSAPTGHSADGGAGGRSDSGQWDPFRPKTLAEQARDALLNKRYGVRQTENHLLPRGNK